MGDSGIFNYGFLFLVSYTREEIGRNSVEVLILECFYDRTLEQKITTRSVDCGNNNDSEC